MVQANFGSKPKLLYDTIRYCVLSVSKKLTDSQLSLPHGMNKKCKTKNKSMSVISPVQSREMKAVQWVKK